MTKIAVWCRHDGDNLIGIGAKIPWHIPSDFRRFRKLTESEALVVGEKTYESFPNRTLRRSHPNAMETAFPLRN